MRIDKIQIENFKNFEKLEVEFEKGVNLFVGSNGSGKTSILEAINVALGGFFSLQEQKMQRGIDISEARIVTVNGELMRIPKTSITAYSEIIDKPWTRNFNSKTKNNDLKFVKPAGVYGKNILESFYETNYNVAPLIAYYSTKRLFRDSYQSSKQKYDPLAGRRNGYLQCLKDSAIKDTLLDWLGSSVTTRATKQIKGVELIDMVLENVDKAIVKTLIYFNEDLLAEDIKIYQEVKFDYDVFLQLKPDFALPVNYYSDGFRNLIYLIIDIIWRASQLNPWLTLEQLAEHQSGCVTIDEIDLHLHPKWQAKTIGILQQLLPNVQFFITTHSPTVVANFKEREDVNKNSIDCLFILDNNVLSKVSSSYFGKDINSVLENPMGGNMRAKEVTELLSRFYAIAENPNSTQEELDSLSEIAIVLNDLLDGTDKDVIKVNSIVELLNAKKP
jgi:predicted ATP-binding protein involved in virulence